MKNNIDICIHDIDEPAWTHRVEEFLYEVLERRNHRQWQVSVLFCADTYMQELNYQYRQKEGSTDVLSFEQGFEYTHEDGNTYYVAGDIAISLDFLYKNAKDFAVSPDEELKRLLIHGILHLEGYDHGDAHIGEEINEMFTLQEEILKTFQDYNIIG
ncbi:MAG: rRNA maturation RNase YbeY [Spirochaetales bacterium]